MAFTIVSMFIGPCFSPENPARRAETHGLIQATVRRERNAVPDSIPSVLPVPDVAPAMRAPHGSGSAAGLRRRDARCAGARVCVPVRAAPRAADRAIAAAAGPTPARLR